VWWSRGRPTGTIAAVRRHCGREQARRIFVAEMVADSFLIGFLFRRSKLRINPNGTYLALRHSCWFISVSTQRAVRWALRGY